MPILPPRGSMTESSYKFLNQVSFRTKQHTSVLPVHILDVLLLPNETKKRNLYGFVDVPVGCVYLIFYIIFLQVFHNNSKEKRR
jgi:hypothetical protein